MSYMLLHLVFCFRLPRLAFYGISGFHAYAFYGIFGFHAYAFYGIFGFHAYYGIYGFCAFFAFYGFCVFYAFNCCYSCVYRHVNRTSSGTSAACLLLRSPQIRVSNSWCYTAVLLRRSTRVHPCHNNIRCACPTR